MRPLTRSSDMDSGVSWVEIPHSWIAPGALAALVALEPRWTLLAKCGERQEVEPKCS